MRSRGTRGKPHCSRTISKIRRDLWQGEKTVSDTSLCTSQNHRIGNHQKKGGPLVKAGLLSSGESLLVVSGDATTHGNSQALEIQKSCSQLAVKLGE